MILAVTPARGGSRGIPRKNIKYIEGKPLIAWSIGHAQDSQMIDQYVVSTEDNEIASVAKQYNAQVAHRSHDLADGSTGIAAVVRDLLPRYDCKAIVLLQATSPVRRPGLIDYCIQEFLKSNADAVVTGFECKLKEFGTYNKPRQELDGFFYDDGNVYVVTPEVIRAGRLWGKNVKRKVISPWENVEIEKPFDFWLCGKILNDIVQNKLDPINFPAIQDFDQLHI